jgi:hypothetical protein
MISGMARQPDNPTPTRSRFAWQMAGMFSTLDRNARVFSSSALSERRDSPLLRLRNDEIRLVRSFDHGPPITLHAKAASDDCHGWQIGLHSILASISLRSFRAQCRHRIDFHRSPSGNIAGK